MKYTAPEARYLDVRNGSASISGGFLTLRGGDRGSGARREGASIPSLVRRWTSPNLSHKRLMQITDWIGVVFLVQHGDGLRSSPPPRPSTSGSRSPPRGGRKSARL
ncbi:hypothetical protein DAETH_30650 [Deinococcus aetherius]|uniref:Uncharacterized protein n=1 Tax=Deinococcus aetherius TaxID=200252 RepID=A0ABN6RIA4_9DEIO|nr:hypothetical protein DAETH_30650 [Deinococcus aetherius]